MPKALLVGNGVTSYLIHDYEDKAMMGKLHHANPELIDTINQKFDIFRDVYRNDGKDEERIIEIIKSMPHYTHSSAAQIYKQYFEGYGLKFALSTAKLSGIETLLKAAKLLNMAVQNELIEIANDICFNNGRNGFNAIELALCKDTFADFINSFDLVFTTNYDYLLDDVYKNEVFHLHGGFNYQKTHDECGAVDIIRDKECRKVAKPFLAWGIDGDEKRNSTKGGITFPISFPLYFPLSIIDQYFNSLKTEVYEEIHIWGYSGQNDKHINDSIKENRNIRVVYYYGNPQEVDSESHKKKVADMFAAEGKEVRSVSWKSIWDMAGKQ